MKVKQTFSPSCKIREGSKSCLKAVWIAFFLLAPLVYASANENQGAVDEPGQTEHLSRDGEQTGKKITGVIVDADGNAMPGVTVFIKGTTTGTVTDIDGKYTINSENDADILVFSFIGMTTQEIPVTGKTEISITMESATELLEDVVVVGYGVQKKESVVGAITQAKGEELEQAGGVTNVGEALQGRLPGVTTIQSDGLPGNTDPKIYIRGQSSWNGDGQPLILVDGIERSMGNIDLSEVDQISVLKDASATAVFGVKGANGVILLTTKRGQSGKAQLNVSANTTLKVPSKIPSQVEPYEAMLHANESIMRELMYSPASWNHIVPYQIADKYRNPANEEESYKYPNVDWEDLMLKDFAQDYRVNLNVRGGTDFAKYFGALSFQSTRDIFKGKEYDNGKGYSSEYKYNRFNYRSNLDFNITKTTKFSVNLSGYYGVQEKPNDDLRLVLGSLYELANSLYTPIYPDGLYGLHHSLEWGFQNPIVYLTSSGYKNTDMFQINSDFELEQKLDFITKGLKFKAKFSYDNTMTGSRSVNDGSGGNNNIYRIYDEDGVESIYSIEGINDFDFVPQPWTLGTMNISETSRLRRMNYQMNLSYNRTFAEKHNVTGLALFSREEYAKGNMFPRYREDWVARATYNYDTRYFIDVNGAYNGSEKFGTGYRFDLFPSAALGWMISNEAFMSDFTWIDKLKLRGSYGLVGDDNFSGRWKYMTQWGSGGAADLVSTNFGGSSPYTWYKETVVGNPDLHWETALKSNIGFELSLWKNKITADVDYFSEHRQDILIAGGSRSIPDFYGATPPDVNSGEVEVKGYELVLGFNHTFANKIDVWTKFSLTNAKDKILFKEDPELRPFYLKAEGYRIGQPKKGIPGAILTNWDDIYMATPLASGQHARRPGYYDMVDFDGDGSYNGTYDNAPYGYPNHPQKTWTLTTGAGYKGLNALIMFYGAQNATRTYDTRNFIKNTYGFYEHTADYWTVDNPDGKFTTENFSYGTGRTDPLSSSYDASIVRLKTVEVSYTFNKKACTKIGVKGLKIYANGNNLYVWTTMPDDREFNGAGTQESTYRGDYPTMKRFNLGLNLNF